MTPKLRALLCLMVGLLATVPSAQAQMAEIWVYANLTADESLVSGYAGAELWYPYDSCVSWGWEYQDCWVDYEISLNATLSRDGSLVSSSWGQSYQSDAEVSVAQSNPSPGTWHLEVDSDAWVDWLDFIYPGEEEYYWRSDWVYESTGASANLTESPPQIGSIEPNAALRGGSGQLTIAGEHFGNSPDVQIEGWGVTINVTSASDEYIYANYSIDTSADSGDHAMSVSTLYGTSNSVAFTVQDPTPVITSISPDVWDAGTSFPVTISGSGFGNNPTVDVGPYASVQVNSANGSQINATVTVNSNAPDTEEDVVVTSNGWGGQGFMPAPGGQQTGNRSVTLRAAPPSCGNQQKDALVAEYYTYGVTWKPSCSDVTAPWGTTNFSAPEINTDNEYGAYWTITKDIMPTRLEEIRAAAGELPMPMSSGYRNPAYNYNMQPRGAQNSRHMHGDAADITETNTDRRTLFKSTLGPQYGACVEPLNLTGTWVHFDWRPERPCPPLW